MSNLDAAADLLEKAADVLHTDGWIQGDMVRSSGRCALGAICAAYGHNSLSWDKVSSAAITALATYIDPEWPKNSQGAMYAVSTWNDEPGRTRFEVEEALKVVAKDLRNKRCFQ